MRILPNPFEGNHPDFPPPPPGVPATTASYSRFFSAGAVYTGLVGLIVTRVFRSPRLVRPVNYAVLGCALALPTATMWSQYRAFQSISESMRAEGREPPSPLARIDRLAHWDNENSTLLGCIAGYGLVAAFRRPLYLRLLVSGLGGFFAAHIDVMFAVSKMDETQREKWIAWLTSRQVSFQKHATSSSIYFAMPGVKEALSGPMMEAWNESKKALIPAHEKVGCDLEPWPDSGNAPHVFIQEEGTFLPQTRYRWNPPPATAVAELESHMERLQETRQMLAQESEVLYAWLAEKEKDYYNCKSSPESDDCTEKRRAAETLGAFHNDLWRTVSDHDWMILDARKRMEQYRAMANSSTGQMDAATPALPSAAQAVEPAETLHLLENVLEGIQRRREEIHVFEQSSSQMLAVVGAMHKDISREELQRRIKDAMQSADLDERVVRKLIEAAKARRYRD